MAREDEKPHLDHEVSSVKDWLEEANVWIPILPIVLWKEA